MLASGPPLPHLQAVRVRKVGKPERRRLVQTDRVDARCCHPCSTWFGVQRCHGQLQTVMLAISCMVLQQR